jgi:phytoene synthase
MHIIGFKSQQAVPYAIKLGIAMQLTNILRDVGEDWRAGRCYLPAEELAAYGITDQDLAAGRVSTAWQAFMKFQIERNRRFYQEAEPGIALLHPDGYRAVMAASTLYGAILDAIETQEYDVFRQRAHVSRLRKLSLLPAIWWRSRRLEA